MLHFHSQKRHVIILANHNLLYLNSTRMHVIQTDYTPPAYSRTIQHAHFKLVLA